MSIRHHQSGFHAIEILITIALVGLTGAVGWLYWSNVASKPAATTTASATASTNTSKNTATKTYTSKGLGVAFDYPAAWAVIPNTSDNTNHRGDVDGSEHMLVGSPSGFTLHFNTAAWSGLGGTGPCDDTITDFVSEGKPQLDNAYIQSFKDSGKFVLWISSSNTKDYIKTDCPSMNYNSIIDVKDPATTSDGMNITAPYQLEFGTAVYGEDTITTTRPSEQEYKQAVAILKSLRKI
jgi:hypothetical protein